MKQLAGKKLALVVVDGVGLAPANPGNVVTPEVIPTLFTTMERYGHMALDASGPSVGLEAGQVGNSEVGHLTIGAGRVLVSSLKRIDAAFNDGTWAGHPAWTEFAASGRLHIVGLLSDAGVHAHWATIANAVKLAKSFGVKDIIVHPILDGVDSDSGGAAALLDELLAMLPTECARLGVIMGRETFCDRSGNTSMTAACCNALLQNSCTLPMFTPKSLEAHHQTVGSEASFPAHIFPGGDYIAQSEPVLHTSHRADRAVQVVRMLAKTQPVYTMTTVTDLETVPEARVFFPVVPLEGGLATAFTTHNIANVRIAETCKFPHVTYFLNGYHASRGEKQVEVASPTATLAECPEMNAMGTADATVTAMEAPDNTVVITNIANLDQVGHLGDLTSAVAAAHAVEAALARIYEAAIRNEYTLILMSDHGNAERIEDSGGRPIVGHTDAHVPFTVMPARASQCAVRWVRTTGSLANVAPTVLSLMGLPIPEGMEPPLARLEPVTSSVKDRLEKML